ncbi:hypothetical protein SAMN05192553_101522 [Cyclobacterium xiamenense]|uniref:Uncharacterized protein n=1 Tax=Cyclobacterium xiamenense TaxID=1297121 RepID=A0A1H6UAC4_9BACT|nr:hypothetical protein [Cyclobacterium xiamenense]SEI84782.1 hypothetical protein SAMN05192553_101522 [Cyclobacterium xiamenense]
MVTAAYTTLFSVRILHEYHLNNGEETYGSMSVADQQAALSGYRWQDFLSIRPSLETVRLCNRFQLLLKHRESSFTVLIRSREEGSQESFIALDPDLTLGFFVEYRDPYFENYTQMPFLSGQKMFFSNFLPEATEGVDVELISLESDSDVFSEDWLIPEENFQQVKDRYAKLGVSPVPVGLLLIRMHGESGVRNVINLDGTLKINPTVFKIHFSNRSTFWKYKQASSGEEIETNQPKPLTKKGFVELVPDTDFDVVPEISSQFRFPNPGIKHIYSDGNNYYSEITI